MKIAVINISIRPDAKRRLLPVGLGFVITALKKANIDFDLIDMDINGYSASDMETLLSEKHYDIYAFGCIVSGFKYAMELSQAIRNVNPKAIIIAGNSVADAIPELLLRRTEVDICALGEGDDTVPELIVALQNSKLLHDVAGIAFLEDDKLVITASRPYREHMDDYGFPDWDLFDLEKYQPYFKTASPFAGDDNRCSFPINTARGCPYACTFCYIVVRKKNQMYRRYSERAIADEIIRLHDKYGANHITFWDDYSFPNKEKLRERLETIENLPFKIKWSGIVRADLLTRKDADLIKRAAAAGCEDLAFSLENASPEILKAIDKHLDVNDFLEQCLALHENGIDPRTSIILGYPQETVESIHATIDACEKAKVFPSVGFLLPLPGTQIYQWCKNNHKIESDYDFLMNIGDRQDFHINLTSLSDEVLMQEVAQGFKTLSQKLGLNLDSVFKTQNYQKSTSANKA